MRPSELKILAATDSPYGRGRRLCPAANDGPFRLVRPCRTVVSDVASLTIATVGGYNESGRSCGSFAPLRRPLAGRSSPTSCRAARRSLVGRSPHARVTTLSCFLNTSTCHEETSQPNLHITGQISEKNASMLPPIFATGMRWCTK